MKNKINKTLIKWTFLGIVPITISSFIGFNSNQVNYSQNNNVTLKNQTNVHHQQAKIIHQSNGASFKPGIMVIPSKIPSKQPTQHVVLPQHVFYMPNPNDPKIVNHLSEVISLLKRTDPKKIDFYLSDGNDAFSQKIVFPNLTPFYNPSDEQVFRNQINQTINDLQQLLLMNLKKQFDLQLKDLNNTIRITGIKPKIQWTHSESAYDNRFPDTKANIDLAMQAQSYNTYQFSGYQKIPIPIRAPAKYWKDVQDIEYQYSFVNKRSETITTSWQKMPPNLNLLNIDLPERSNIKLRLASDRSVTFDVKSFNSNSDWMDLPLEINELNKDKKVNFKIGPKGDLSAPIIQKRSGDKRQFYRAVVQIEAEFMPQIGIDEKTFNFINEIDPILNDRWKNYFYVTIGNKKPERVSVSNTAKFKSQRENIISYLKVLKNNDSYRGVVQQYLNHNNTEVLNNLKVTKNIISQKYGISQYHYEIPKEIITTYKSYFLKNGENELGEIYKYEGISNLIANQLRLDPNYGVKSKSNVNGYAYTKEDADQVNLKFQFDSNFIQVLNEIKAINKIIEIIKNSTNENDITFKKLLTEFKLDSQTVEKIFSLRSNNNQYQDAIKNANVSHELIKKIKTIVQDQNPVLEDNLINFYHDLPDMVNDILEQLTIKANVKYSDGTIIEKTIYELQQFKPIEIEDIKYNTLENISNNMVEITLSNFHFQNKIYKLENIDYVDPSSLLINYQQNNTFTSNANFLTYQLNYRKDFKKIQLHNFNDPLFEITRNIDNYGYSANDYLNSTLTEGKTQLIKAAIQTNLNSKLGNLIINEKEIQIIDENFVKQNQKIIDALNAIKEEKDINLNPNDQTGEFYAIIQIQNSNDLINFGSEYNREIYKDNFWFLSQDSSNPKIRNYLIKMHAAKKIIKFEHLEFEVEPEQKKLILKDSDTSTTLSLNLELDSFNKIKNIQNLNILEDKYLKIQFNENISSNDLINQIEVVLSSYNIFLNTNKSFFSLNDKTLHLEIFQPQSWSDSKLLISDAKESNIQFQSIINNPNDKNLEIIYVFNNDPVKKIRINYEIDLKNHKLYLINLNQLNKDLVNIYYDQFQQEINQEITRLLNEVIQNLDDKNYIEMIDINLFINQKNEFDIHQKENLVSNQNESKQSNLDKILIGVFCSIGVISIIGLIIYIIIRKKKSKK